MKVSAFVGTSLDGFLARPNGEYDFLPVDGGEAHGYEEFIASVDTVVMGRNTFDVVEKFTAWPYGERRVVVLSHRPIQSEKVVVMSGAPGQVIDELERKKAKHIYVDGGITVQQFLRAGKVDEITITRVPVLIGEGIPLFGAVPHDIRLRHLGTRQFESGLVSSRYEVIR